MRVHRYKWLMKLSLILAVSYSGYYARAGGIDMMVLGAISLPTLMPMWLTVATIDPCAAGVGHCKYKIGLIEEVNAYAAQFEPGERPEGLVQGFEDQYPQLKYLADKCQVDVDKIVKATFKGKLEKYDCLSEVDILQK